MKKTVVLLLENGVSMDPEVPKKLKKMPIKPEVPGAPQFIMHNDKMYRHTGDTYDTSTKETTQYYVEMSIPQVHSMLTPEGIEFFDFIRHQRYHSGMELPQRPNTIN